MSRIDFRFFTRFRVRYAELDPQAVVFNARYLEYADLAIGEYWRAAGIDGKNGVPFECHVVRALVEYRKPIRMDDEIDALVRVSRFGSSSMTSLIELHGAGAEDLRAAIELVHVHVDLASSASRPIPDAIRAAFERFAGIGQL